MKTLINIQEFRRLDRYNMKNELIEMIESKEINDNYDIAKLLNLLISDRTNTNNIDLSNFGSAYLNIDENFSIRIADHESNNTRTWKEDIRTSDDPEEIAESFVQSLYDGNGKSIYW